VSTNPKIEIHGTSPFKLPSGVFEVQIALSDKKPSASSIAEKNFPSLWKDNFHLNVSDGKFSLKFWELMRILYHNQYLILVVFG